MRLDDLPQVYLNMGTLIQLLPDKIDLSYIVKLLNISQNLWES